MPGAPKSLSILPGASGYISYLCYNMNMVAHGRFLRPMTAFAACAGVWPWVVMACLCVLGIAARAPQAEGPASVAVPSVAAATVARAQSGESDPILRAGATVEMPSASPKRTAPPVVAVLPVDPSSALAFLAVASETPRVVAASSADESLDARAHVELRIARAPPA